MTPLADVKASRSATRSDGMASADLRSAWEEHAAEFIAWAREDHRDSYWRFHRDQFLELVSPPGRRTLDLGCGEGRLSRDLKRLGHDVVAVDASPTMVAAAREAESGLDARLADAAALPIDDGAFELVVSRATSRTARSRSRAHTLRPPTTRTNFVRDGLEITFVTAHRPLQAYMDAIAAAGFLVERLRETDVPDGAVEARRSRRWQRLPLFLHIRAVK